MKNLEHFKIISLFLFFFFMISLNHLSIAQLNWWNSTNGGVDIVNTNSGNVGIGTSIQFPPSHKLHVMGDIFAIGNLYWGGNSTLSSGANGGMTFDGNHIGLYGTLCPYLKLTNTISNVNALGFQNSIGLLGIEFWTFGGSSTNIKANKNARNYSYFLRLKCGYSKPNSRSSGGQE